MTQNDNETKVSRRIPDPDRNLLWQNSAGRCAKPDCRIKCVIEPTSTDSATTIGEMAHIFAHSKMGPRPNPDLLVQERNSYDNLILLCGNHHTLVDGQENTYTVTELKRWKNEHERWVNQRLAQEEFSHAELEIVTRYVAETNSSPSTDFTLRTPLDKMRFNNLSNLTQTKITMGLVKVGIVRSYIEYVAKIDTTYPERLVNPLVNQYTIMRTNGLNSDQIFEELQRFACGNSFDFNIMSAGLAVIVYFFERCEIFEK